MFVPTVLRVGEPTLSRGVSLYTRLHPFPNMSITTDKHVVIKDDGPSTSIPNLFRPLQISFGIDSSLFPSTSSGLVVEGQQRKNLFVRAKRTRGTGETVTPSEGARGKLKSLISLNGTGGFVYPPKDLSWSQVVSPHSFGRVERSHPLLKDPVVCRRMVRVFRAVERCKFTAFTSSLLGVLSSCSSLTRGTLQVTLNL